MYPLIRNLILLFFIIISGCKIPEISTIKSKDGLILRVVDIDNTPIQKLNFEIVTLKQSIKIKQVKYYKAHGLYILENFEKNAIGITISHEKYGQQCYYWYEKMPDELSVKLSNPEEKTISLVHPKTRIRYREIPDFIYLIPNKMLTKKDYSNLENEHGLVTGYLNDTGISGLAYKNKKPFQRSHSQILISLEKDYGLQIAFPIEITEISPEDSQITNYNNGDIILLSNQIFINPLTYDSFSSNAYEAIQANHLQQVTEWAELKVSNCSNNSSPFSCLVEPIYSTGLSIIDIHHALKAKHQIENILWVYEIR